MKHWADGGETSLRNTVLLCRRHHRTVHEGQVKVCTNRDGTVLFFTPKGRVLADAPVARVRAEAPKRPAWADAPNGRVLTDAPAVSLPLIPSAHSGALSMDESANLSNGAAIYRDSAIPWAVEAAAREAMEDSLEH